MLINFTHEALAIEKTTSLWESLIKVNIGSFFPSRKSTLITSPKADVTIIIEGLTHLIQLQIRFVLFLET